MNKIIKSNASELENPTDKQLFKPSANQEKWLDTAIETMSKSPSEISQACGIDRTVWYDWIKLPEFIAWYRAEWDKRLMAHSPKLDVIGMKMAERDPKVLELMMRRVGTLKDSKESQVALQFNFSSNKYIRE